VDSCRGRVALGLIPVAYSESIPTPSLNADHTQPMPKILNQLYPHLRSREIELWQRFLQTHPGRFSEMEYDVRVGEGIQIPGSPPLALNRMAEALTKQRIDVVDRSGGQTTLVEIAPSAGTDSLGQLLVYRQLWKEEHPGEPDPKLVLITDIDRPDIRRVAESSGVEMIIV